MVIAKHGHDVAHQPIRGQARGCDPRTRQLLAFAGKIDAEGSALATEGGIWHNSWLGFAGLRRPDLLESNRYGSFTECQETHPSERQVPCP